MFWPLYYLAATADFIEISLLQISEMINAYIFTKEKEIQKPMLKRLGILTSFNPLCGPNTDTVLPCTNT